jgi:phage antirepressor YoqD-like protein
VKHEQTKALQIQEPAEYDNILVDIYVENGYLKVKTTNTIGNRNRCRKLLYK